MKIRKLLAFFLIIILAGTSFELGMWQLHRAREEKASAHPHFDSHIYNLGQVAQAGSNLTGESVNKLVSIRGRYIKNYVAAGQSPDPAKNLTAQNSNSQLVAHPVTLDVRLLQLSGSDQSVLVVRGIYHSDSATDFKLSSQPTVEVKLTGRLYPRQSSDLTSISLTGSTAELTRLDPSLVVSDSTGKIFDGYVVESSETFINPAGSFNPKISPIEMKRLPINPIISTTAGFYWQHIAYVVIWWFFSLLILMAPFYNRLRKRFEVIENNNEHRSN